jgi:Domain of unknown function (DUF4129)
MSALLLRAAAAPVGGDEARRDAARELSKPVYHADDPSLLQRAIDKVSEWLSHAGGRINPNTPGGLLALLVLLLVVLGLVGLVVWRTGGFRRSAARGDLGLAASGPLGAEEHRQLADRYAAQRRYAEAVRERMRAVVRELEARGVLEPRVGRTAAEVALEGGRLVPAVATDLRTAARLFDEVWYGGRPATAGTDAAMREVDQRVRSARLAVVSR